MKTNIELPFFPGLYESDLCNGDTTYWAIKDELEYYQHDYCWDNPEEHPIYEQLTENDLDFDFARFSKDIVEYFVEAWKDHAPEIVLAVENPNMVSPRYYNFSTDRIYADIKLREDWQEVMRHFIALNYDWLKDRIHEDWTSYDGFCSFMENDIDEWDGHLFVEQDDRYISTMLGYMMYRDNKEIRNDLVMQTIEDMYVGSYVYITDEGKQKLEDLKAQREEDIREGRIVLPDPAQLEIPFED